MKIILSLFLFLALTASASTPARVSLPEASLGTAEYDVKYRLAGITTHVATATISFEESEWEGKPAYHSSALIKTQPFFRLFLNAEYKAEAWFSRNDLSPLHFVHSFKDGKYEVFYDYDSRIARSVWTAEGKETVVREDEFREKKAMDLLSALHFVRFNDFKKVGESEDILIVMPREARDGDIGWDDDHLVLRIKGEGVMENGSGNQMSIWRSTDSDRRIQRLEMDLSSGSLRCILRP